MTDPAQLLDIEETRPSGGFSYMLPSVATALRDVTCTPRGGRAALDGKREYSLNTKRKKGRALLAVALAATTVGAFALGGSGTASAADGDVVLAIDFSGLNPGADVAAAEASASTDFIKANPVLGDHYGDNTMYDEGRYVIGSNPADFHVAWADYAADPGYVVNPKLILNGFTSTDQNVFTVTTQGEVCATPGSSITFSFQAKMANVLPLSYANDGGAKITVLINGESIGSEVVLTNDPSNPIEILGSAPAAADGSLVVSIVNNSTVLSATTSRWTTSSSPRSATALPRCACRRPRACGSTTPASSPAPARRR